MSKVLCIRNPQTHSYKLIFPYAPLNKLCQVPIPPVYSLLMRLINLNSHKEMYVRPFHALYTLISASNTHTTVCILILTCLNLVHVHFSMSLCPYLSSRYPYNFFFRLIAWPDLSYVHFFLSIHPHNSYHSPYLIQHVQIYHSFPFSWVFPSTDLLHQFLWCPAATGMFPGRGTAAAAWRGCVKPSGTH